MPIETRYIVVGNIAPQHPALFAVILLPEAVRNTDLPHPQQCSQLEPRLERSQLHLHAEMSAPRTEPGKEVARPEETTVSGDVLEILLIHGPARIPRQDKECSHGTLLGVESFVQGPRCRVLVRMLGRCGQRVA